MPDIPARRPLDQDFIDAQRARIDVAMILGKVQNHIIDPELYPLSSRQLKAAELLLKKVMPDLQRNELAPSDDFAATFAAAVRAATIGNNDPVI